MKCACEHYQRVIARNPHNIRRYTYWQQLRIEAPYPQQWCTAHSKRDTTGPHRLPLVSTVLHVSIMLMCACMDTKCQVRSFLRRRLHSTWTRSSRGREATKVRLRTIRLVECASMTTSGSDFATAHVFSVYVHQCVCAAHVQAISHVYDSFTYSSHMLLSAIGVGSWVHLYIML